MRVALLAALGVGLVGGDVRATVVHHVNPGPGETGHYAWSALVEIPTWLDITLPAVAQTNAETGTSIAQGLGGFPGGWAAWGVLLGGSVNPGQSSTFAVADDDHAFVLALSKGDTLAGLRYDGWSLYAAGMPPNANSLFPEGARRYIGVRTDDGRFGWVEVARSGQSLAALSWAYETEPGVPIAAGQVPAPGGTALLAVGLLAAAPRRRLRP